MENTIILTSGQKIEVLMQDEVSLDIDCSLRYIESGKKEVEEYVEQISKLRLDTIVEEAKEEMETQIAQGVIKAKEQASQSAKETIDENISSIKTEIDAYISNEIKPDIENAKEEASQSAQQASQVAETLTDAYNNLSSSLQQASQVASGNIGDIKYTLRSSEPHGGVWCDGSIITAEQYPDLYQMLSDNNLAHITSAEYESQISENGCCYSFSIDEVNQTIKVPTIPIADSSNYRAYVVCFTGKDTEIDITQEIELNNPFFLGMSKYFESKPDNASWLVSNGAFHSGTVYKSFYEWLLRIYNGTETVEGVSVKANTDGYNKYDYVINTADQTFRLPLLNGSEEASGDVFEAWDISASGQTFTAPVNGRVSFVVTATASGQHAEVNASNGNVALSRATASGQTVCASAFAKKGSTIRVYYHTSSTIQWLRFYYSVGNGSLYYYVGETIQDANIINASRVLTRVSELSDSYISGLVMPSTKHITLTLGASGSSYTAPANGYFSLSKVAGISNAYSQISSNAITSINRGVVGSDWCICWLPVTKGENVIVVYTATGATNHFRFYYAEGEK